MSSLDSDGVNEESDVDPCAYCGQSIDSATDSWVCIDVSWGSATLNDEASYAFCSQHHAAAFLTESPFPEPTPRGIEYYAEPDRMSRLLVTGGAILVVLNLAIYVLGFVTWLRWIWS